MLATVDVFQTGDSRQRKFLTLAFKSPAILTILRMLGRGGPAAGALEKKFQTRTLLVLAGPA